MALTRFSTRYLKNLIPGVVLTLLVLILARLLLPADPGAGLFARGEQLEAAGQLDSALRHYELLTSSQPNSSYTPQALQREGDILTGLASSRNDMGQFGQAVKAYLQLAEFKDQDSGHALLAAAFIVANNLHQPERARHLYMEVLQRYPDNQQYASEATLRLGQIYLAQNSGKAAQAQFQRVLEAFPNDLDHDAQAQYYLGLTYETLFKNPTWARDAYNITIKRYPQTVWANNAQGRLGMLFYNLSRSQEPPRRVLIETQPVPETDADSDPRFAALMPLLGARGLPADEVLLRGWSLQPFYGAYDPTDPGRVVNPTTRAFDNATANCGLGYTIVRARDKASALLNLQHTLDSGEPAMVYDGHWNLAVGYDSSTNQVTLQDQGVGGDTLGVSEFTASWAKPSPLSGGYTLLAFRAPGDRPLAIGATLGAVPASPTGTTAPIPTATPFPSLTAPFYALKLTPLSQAAADRRALRHAVIMMQQPQDGPALLNLEALTELAARLDRLSARPASQIPTPETEVGAAVPAATPTAGPPPPASAPNLSPEHSTQRVRALSLWFNAPLQQWLAQRRDAAAFLDAAATTLAKPGLNQAADALRQSVAALQSAAANLPDDRDLGDEPGDLNEVARLRLQTVAHEVGIARDAERRAVQLMIAGQ